MAFIPHRRPVFACTLFLAAIALSTGPIVADDKDDALLEKLEQQAFKEASALAGPSVVQIQTTGGRDIVGRVLTGTGPTTGVIVSKDGYIITSSFNFISKPSTILVNLADGRKNLLAKVVATDHSKMLTLIKIDGKNLPVAAAAPKKSIKVGQWSIALGRTFSADTPNISVGTISALDRIWGRALQTDAKISPVNYGGPLVSIEGKFQGILVPLSTRGKGETAGVQWYDSGIGFAVPMEDVYRAVKTLKTGKDLHAGLMGASFRGAGLLGGAPVIDRVAAGSPSALAGLKRGDKIVEIDGRKIVRSGGIKHALGNKYAGDKVKVLVERDGKKVNAELTLVAKLVPYNPTFLGILPQRPFGDQLQPGVLIRHIFKDGPAAKAGLERRDRIVKVNGKDVVDIAGLADAISRLKPKAKARIEYLRGDDRKTVSVALGTIPNEVLSELTRTALPPGKADGVKTGRFTVNMPNHEREYWAYVPANYNPSYRYTVMVWLHPGDDTMEATVYKNWKNLCDQRGILILAPKAGKLEGFVPNELEFVKDSIDDFTGKYSVDPKRVFVHSFDDGVKFAFQLAFRYPEKIRGVAAAGAALQAKPPGNSAAAPQQFHFVCGSDDEIARFVKTAVSTLRNAKYPTSSTMVKDQGHEYPKAKELDEIARWADSLDRI